MNMQEWVTQIQAAEKQRNWQTMHDLAQAFCQQFADIWQGFWWWGLAESKLGDTATAERVWTHLTNAFPAEMVGIQGLLELAQQQNDAPKVAALCELGINRFPEKPLFYQKLTQYFRANGQFDQATIWLNRAMNAFADDPAWILDLAHTHLRQRQFEKAIGILQRGLLKMPQNQAIAFALMQAYLDFNEIQAAQAIFAQYIVDKSTPETELKRLLIEKQTHGNAHYVNALAHLHQQYPQNLSVILTYAQTLLQQNREMGELAYSILRQSLDFYPQNSAIIYAFIRACVHLGRNEQALQIIHNLPADNSSEYAHFQAWAAAQHGDFALAKQHFSHVAKRFFYAELRDCADELLDLNATPLQLKRGDVPLFCVQRNEMLRLPSFLAHYRKLGVSHFVFVDNASNDGSREFLLQQPDCYVFYTAASYQESGSGIAWVNHLIHKYALENEWAIHADVDELLIYPHCETRRLPLLIAYLNAQNAEVMSSYMIDMFAKNPFQAAFNSGDDMLTVAPYFYHQYDFGQQLESPYLWVQGGIFAHFDVLLPLVKTALFKVQADFDFVCATHKTTPARVADVSATYLHFKMLGDLQHKSHTEIARKQHANGGRMYQKYAEIYAQHFDENTDLSRLPHSVPYQDSGQLVKLGLLKTSDDWVNFIHK